MREINQCENDVKGNFSDISQCGNDIKENNRDISAAMMSNTMLVTVSVGMMSRTT